MILDLSEILESLSKITKEDGKISTEEVKFLNTLRKDIEIFQESVNLSSHDGYISDDQLHEIIIQRDKILTSSFQSENISADVENLVNQLYEEINKFTIPGMGEENMDLNSSKFVSQTSHQPSDANSPPCIWCKQQAGYREEEGKFDSRWGVTVHKVKIYICKHCGYSHLFSLRNSIWDID